MEGDLMKRISIGIACVVMAAISVGCGKSSPQQETSAPRVASDDDRAGHNRAAQDQPAQELNIDQGERTIELQAQQANRAIDDVTAKADSTVARAVNQAEDVSEAVDAVEQAIKRPLLQR